MSYEYKEIYAHVVVHMMPFQYVKSDSGSGR